MSTSDIESSVNPKKHLWSDKTLELLSQYHYCVFDYSKLVEKVHGYSQNNTGQFHVNPDSDRLDKSIENAVNMRKIPNTEENIAKVYELVAIIKNETIKPIFDIVLIQVECPICKRVTVAPKLEQGILANKKLRKNQVKIISDYANQQQYKYFPRRYLTLKMVILIILFSLTAMLIIANYY